ncbi:uncharacterized protein STEHIDRAFT_172031 [Stereum hirsutum FP-91666 SS1]|uniref:uncharacterized protein n=1 Tax=Stereum hirsutum (strain FP-91666) TaxID=721885 RepID=UPI0004449C09|nr:uncharacterized protein STEHIDRAFT_172031 [Stereum hirsutum FP-91666 SS1]EIM80941.1 hypothetical protein STEHIDRAFT_172031 [Stereum hirsutum FP-91666 SS1]
MPAYLVPHPTDAQIDCAVGICIRAYDGDTALKAMIGGDLNLADIFFRSMLRGGALEGSLYIANDGKDASAISSVSVCFPPGVSCWGSEEQRKLGFYELWDGLSPETKRWWEGFQKDNIQWLRSLLGPNLGTEWVVSLIATNPAEQHQGLATSIMNAVCDQAAREHRMVGLSTQTADNAAWYESLGFTKLAIGDLMGGFKMYFELESLSSSHARQGLAGTLHPHSLRSRLGASRLSLIAYYRLNTKDLAKIRSFADDEDRAISTVMKAVDALSVMYEAKDRTRISDTDVRATQVEPERLCTPETGYIATFLLSSSELSLIARGVARMSELAEINIDVKGDDSVSCGGLNGSY